MKFKDQILIINYWAGDNRKKIKQWFIYLLIASLSFGLGYLTNKEFTYSPIIIEKYTTVEK